MKQVASVLALLIVLAGCGETYDSQERKCRAKGGVYLHYKCVRGIEEVP